MRSRGAKWWAHYAPSLFLYSKPRRKLCKESLSRILFDSTDFFQKFDLRFQKLLREIRRGLFVFFLYCNLNVLRIFAD